MHDSIEKAKSHLKEHKKFYLGFGVGVVLAGITTPIMRSNIAQGGMSESIAQRGMTNTASLIFRSPQTVNITAVLDREGRGHPGWPCRNLESKRIFFSQREAAMTFDIPEGILSGHLQGKFPDAHGLHFERVNLAEAK